MNLLLISNSTNAGEEYLKYPMPQISEHLKGIREVAFVPYAAVTFSYAEYERKVQKRFDEIGIRVRSVHRADDPVRMIRRAEAVCVGGGNTFALAKKMQQQGLMSAILRRIKDGVPYVGWSAGSNVCCPTICTTNDMPIIEPESFDCMNLVPFQINPHYTDFFDPKHGGETRDDRLNEFIKVNPQMWVAGIREATALRLKEGRLSLTGRNNKMKVFRYGQEPKEYSIEDDINFLMR